MIKTLSNSTPDEIMSINQLLEMATAAGTAIVDANVLIKNFLSGGELDYKKFKTDSLPYLVMVLDDLSTAVEMILDEEIYTGGSQEDDDD